MLNNDKRVLGAERVLTLTLGALETLEQQRAPVGCRAQLADRPQRPARAPVRHVQQEGAGVGPALVEQHRVAELVLEAGPGAGCQTGPALGLEAEPASLRRTRPARTGPESVRWAF